MHHSVTGPQSRVPCVCRNDQARVDLFLSEHSRALLPVDDAEEQHLAVHGV